MRSMFSKGLILTTALLFFAAIGLAAAPQAILTELKGKVEVKLLSAKAWIPATEGMKISTLTSISTGFDSSVKIVIDQNTILVKPLTRMTIDKLAESQGKVTTNCFLRVGSVKAEVKSAEGVKQDFKVQSPYSTASVRGTGFEHYGVGTIVEHGLVSVIPGRPQRDFDLPAGYQGDAPDLGGDFTGSPDTPADPNHEVLLGPGKEVVLALVRSGLAQMLANSDRDSLHSDSVVGLSSNGAGSGESGAGSGNPAGQTSQYGSVTITLQE